MYTKELFRKDWDMEDQRVICKVIGRRKQGNWLEVPCMYCFVERQQFWKKLEVLFHPNIASFCQVIIFTDDLTNPCQCCSSSLSLIVVAPSFCLNLQCWKATFTNSSSITNASMAVNMVASYDITYCISTIKYCSCYLFNPAIYSHHELVTRTAKSDLLSLRAVKADPLVRPKTKNMI